MRTDCDGVGYRDFHKAVLQVNFDLEIAQGRCGILATTGRTAKSGSGSGICSRLDFLENTVSVDYSELAQTCIVQAAILLTQELVFG